jgi:fibronectin-binding autotransporter adhesin
MWLISSSRTSKPQASRSRRPQRRAARDRTRLVLEPLEPRALLTSYSAASVSALVADITAANTNGGANTITLTAATTAPYVFTAVNNTTNGATGLPVIAANDKLTIVGGGDTIERSTASGTPIFRLLDVATGGSLTLQSLTLQGGSATFIDAELYSVGGAIYNQGALTLSGVTVQNNTTLLAGGGIYSYEGSVTLEGGSIVSDNDVVDSVANGVGGGGGGLYAEYSTVTVTNATLDNNSVSGTEAYGGGICVYDSTVTLSSAALSNNLVTGNGYGGGLFVGSNTVLGLPIRQGVGVSSTLTATNTTLDMNTVDATGSYLGVDRGGGGGLYMIFSAATLSNDTVDSNTVKSIASSNGGGLYFVESTATLSNDTVDSNTVKGGRDGEGGDGVSDGGGLYFDAGTATLSNDTVESNTVEGGLAGSYGGGLYFYGGTATLSNDTVESNTASKEHTTAAYGGGIYIGGACAITLDPFTVANTINNTDGSGLNGTTANIDGTYKLS